LFDAISEIQNNILVFPQTLREGADMKDIKSLEKVEKFLKLCHREIVAKCFG